MPKTKTRVKTRGKATFNTVFILPIWPSSRSVMRHRFYKNTSPTVLHIWAFCTCPTLIASALPVQGRPWEVHHTWRVHPYDQGHHHGNGQSSGCRELGSAGGRDRHGQPEPQSHLWYAGYLQGVNPHRPARTGLMQTSAGCQRAQPAESR